MTAQIVDCFYAPSIDNAWSKAPGALAAINAFAPLQMGAYGSMTTANYLGTTTLATNGAIGGELFRKMDGTVRLLVYYPSGIVEYNSSGTATPVSSEFTATTSWESASWGDWIFAVSPDNSMQKSTGGSFSAVSAAPVGSCIAANGNFVIVGNICAGTYATNNSGVMHDGVAWCAIGNPNDWTPDLATQAGWMQVTVVPGPIRQLRTFGDGFLCWKDNGIAYLRYLGPNASGSVFSQELVTDKIGTIAPHSVAALDGKWYFLHSSGLYEFDGQQIRNIGIPVHQQFLVDAGYWGNKLPVTFEGLGYVSAAVDDIDGIVWFRTAYYTTGPLGTHPSIAVYHGYNARTGRWGRLLAQTSTGAEYPRMIRGTTADMQAFKQDTAGHCLTIWNDSANGATLRSLRYPVATADAICEYTTGIYGSVDGAAHITQHHWRTLAGTAADSGMTVTTTGYSSENALVANGSNVGAINTEFDYADVRLGSRFRKTQVQWSLGKIVYLAGCGFDGIPGGKR